ncbi:MAG: L-serine ammonia-lyase [Gammaproteobacteria bacterium]|nr:L-serine ammonia-lyase [Gammaproteobacteria bacterium]NND60536.1 L-serine ammonia-lyase [Gammaproteobacteria bacterium]
MMISIFEIFKIGVGPSSSHTVGPMRAARRFLVDIESDGRLDEIATVEVGLYGSLALTGKGHCTDIAVLAGLEGAEPDSADPEAIQETVRRVGATRRIQLMGSREIDFDPDESLVFHYTDTLPQHPNGMLFVARNNDGEVISEQEFFSVGGGFVLRGDEMRGDVEHTETDDVPYPYSSADQLLAHCEQNGLAIHELVWANERVWRSDDEIRAGLQRIWDVFKACVQRGLHASGNLPGRLAVPRRAPGLWAEIKDSSSEMQLGALDYVNAYAFAVNEENAAGGQVVTAPTNGAAGIVPAVLHYYKRFVDTADEDGVFRFMLTAGAIAILYKKNASISGAEMGCQGEVGVACSMAAGGLTAALGGSNGQVENAAEIGMEHNLGLTCDPVGGLVQIPCIERNAMGAVKAINAARMALRGDGRHKVSLDQVIATMRQTGKDMSSIYKETSRGGLAVNVIEC